MLDVDTDKIEGETEAPDATEKVNVDHALLRGADSKNGTEKFTTTDIATMPEM